MNDHCKRRVLRKNQKNIFFEVPRRFIPADTTLFKPPIFGGFRPATFSEFDALAVCRRDHGRADIENRIKELGRHFHIKGRCGQKFWSTEAACHLAIAAENLCVLRQRRLGQLGKCEQVTLRCRLFTRPAVFSRVRARRPPKLAIEGRAVRGWWVQLIEKLTAPLDCHAIESLQA